MTQQFKALVLHACNTDMTNYNSFVFPQKGHVVCPDWDPKEWHGKGFYGALWGLGDGMFFPNAKNAVWQVVGINEWNDYGNIVKYPEGWVVFTGNKKDATDYIRENGAKGAVIGATAVSEKGETVVTGDMGTSISEKKSTVISGQWGIATSGKDGTSVVTRGGYALAGNYGVATAGYQGTAVVGHDGTATAGHYGTAIAGDKGTATTRLEGKSTSGDLGMSFTEHFGMVRAGTGGILNITYFDGRTRTKTAYVGEDGIKPNVFYKLDEEYNFVEA